MVLSDVGLHSMIMARLCEAKRIPIIFYVYNPVLFTVPFWTRLLLESVRARYVFAATQHMADVFQKTGRFPQENLRVVGDVFASKVGAEELGIARKKWREELGVRGAGKLVLALSFFVGPDISETQKRRFLRCTSDGVKEVEGARLIVKAHPNEDKALLTRMLAEEGVEPIFVAHTESLRELLLASDAACMVYSQAGMEVVMMDIPLFIVQDEAMLQGYEDWVPYVREGAAVFVPDTSRFADALRPILFSPEARRNRLEQAAKFREKYITSSGFDPMEKMVEEIKIVLNEVSVN